MVDVAVLVRRIVDVAAPFHELAISTYLIRSQIVENLLPAFHLVGIDMEHLGGTDAVEQNLAHYGMGKRCTFVDGSVFGRCRGSRSQCAIGFAP